MSLDSLQEIRDLVRTHIDADSEELPDNVLDSFVRDGYRRIIRRSKRWPFFETEYTFSSTAGTQTYTYSTIAPTLETVRGIIGRYGPLQYQEHELMHATYPPSDASTSEPEFYSLWDDKVYLWPTPDDEYDYTLLAYRGPTDWTRQGSGSTPDFHEDFSEVLQSWVLYRGYMFLDDPEEATVHKQAFLEGLDEVAKSLLRTPEPQPVVLNGGKRALGLPPRLRFPFE